MYVAGFMAYPLMYAMICKYTLRCYPRSNKPVPEKIMALKKAILDSMNLKEQQTPFVLKIHFQVCFSCHDINRFSNSTDKHVKHYLSINPGYTSQVGVLVIIPVTLGNMAYTFLRHILRKLSKNNQWL